MVLVYWWMSGVWAVAVILLFGVFRKKVFRVGKKQLSGKVVRAAHSRRITQLPEYVAQQRIYRRWLLVLLVTIAVSIVAAMFLSSRPAQQSLVTPAQANRDIMLCLDISGSMSSVDTKIAETFTSLVHEFKGQRIGLELFNFNSSLVFPLNDDYSLIDEQLSYAQKMFPIGAEITKYYSGLTSTSPDPERVKEYNTYIAGTSSNGLNGDGGGWAPSSNVGIGLTSCITHLGDNESGRSQSVILATDNELGGVEENALITTKQAMLYAKKKGVHVYSIDPGVYNDLTGEIDPEKTDNFQGEHEILKNYSLVTSGNYYRLSSEAIVPDIIAKISAQETKLFVGDSQYAATDTPLAGFVVLFVTVGGVLVLVWRLRL